MPGSGDAAIINNGGTVTLDMDVTVQSLTLSGLYSTLGGSGTITVTNMMAWSSHTTMAGTGATNIASSATLTVTVGWGNPGNHYPILDTRTLNIMGTAILTSANPADILSRLGLANGATINNNGTLDFQSDTGMAQDNGNAGSVNNSGTFRKSAGTGTSPVYGVLVNNTGTVQALTGTLSLAGGGTSTGSFNAAAGATLDFGGGTQVITLSPTSSISGAGSVSFSGGTTTIGGSGTYAVAGATVIGGGGTLNLNMDGTTANMTLSGFGSTLGGSGAITVTNIMDWSSQTHMVGTGATNIASGATLTITVGWGNWGNHYPILDTRTLNIAGTAILTSTNPADIYSRLGLANGATISNNGTLDFQSDTGMAQDNGNAGSVNNSGTFRKSGGTGTSTVGVAFNNTGIVQAMIGTLSFTGFTQNSGVTMLNGGSLASASGPLNFYGGTLQGVGTITGNVANIGGTVSPGNSPGILHIAGNYSQGPTGTLNIELGGVISGTQYDLLDVTGAASLNGTLDVSLINSFTPISGTVFQIVNFSTRSGDFITETGTIIGGGLYLLPYYSSDHLDLIAGTMIADLGLSLTDGSTWAIAGRAITYTIVVTNAGPDPASGALITDTLPETISGVSWTCVATGGVCAAPSGSGNISTTVNLNAGGVVTVTVSGLVAPGANGTLVNTAYVSYLGDPNTDNNHATDSDIVYNRQVYIPLVIKQ